MPNAEPADSDVKRRIRESFAQQGLMTSIGARLTQILAGEVEIELPFRSDLTQQHGYIHAGIITALMDNACGYAAMSLAPAGTEVLTVEYKVNFLAPGRGARFAGRGRVVRSGRRFTVCTGEVIGVDGSNAVQVACMLATIITIASEGRDPVPR
jgi:uncharacterized protein (TIGR00369 family)